MKQTVMKTLLITSLSCAITSLVWAQVPPTIASFTPTSGSVGITVTISGTFNVTANKNVVYFGGVKAAAPTGNATTLTVAVPSGTTYGLITVTDTAAVNRLTAYSSKPFTPTFGALPVIDSTVFAAKVNYSVSPSTSPIGIALGDIDGDGKLDVVVANSGSGDIRIMRNTSVAGGLTGSSFVTPGVSYPAGIAPTGVALGDLDGDGDLDIAVSDTVSGKVFVWRNGSTPGAIDSTSMSSFAVGNRTFGLYINDIDINGKPEIFVARKDVDSISILRNTSTGILSFEKTSYSTGVGSNPVEVRAQADIDGDGQLDVVTVNSGNSRSSVFLNGGSFPGTIVLGTSSSWILGSGATSFVLTDLDGDDKLDIVSANKGGSVSLLRNASSIGSTSFSAKVDIGAGSAPFSINLADLDGDGKPDLVVTNRSVDSISVLRNTATSGAFSTSTLAAPVRFSVGTSPSGVALGDVDGDGKPEIVVANQGSDNVSVLRNKAIRQVAEVGNDSTLASPISVGETIQSVLTSGSDVDYYKFVLNPGDTVIVEANPANNGNLTVQFEIFDTSGNYFKGRYERLDESRSWFVLAPNLVAPRAFLLRVVSAYNNTYFPNSRPEGHEPQIVPGSAAAVDSGYYQLSVERFVPSAPRIYYYTDVYNESYDRARWWLEFYPNGISTTASIEYSTSPDLSGSIVVPANQSPGTGIYRTYFDSPLTGLSPNTRYYFRAIASNALGSAQTSIYQFDTPPAPVGWIHQFVGVNNSIMGISYGDDTTGIAVGYGNLMKRTTNAGESWTAFPNPVSGNNLYGVWMVNSLLGFAVGSSESIAKTTDGGASWTNLPNTGTGYELWRVKFVNPLAGVAVGSGGLIVKTANNGASWILGRPVGGYELRGVDYADLNTVVAVGYNGTVLRSTNGGTAWDSIPRQPSWPYYLYRVDFVSSTTGYIVANNAVLKSTDAGLTWNVINIPNINLPWLYDISFKDANNGIIVGEIGTIIRTTDGGASWKREVTGAGTNLYSSAYRGRSLAVGGDNGLVLSSLDPKSEVEPNDATGSAILIAYRDEVDARIDPADVDYYKFTATAADTIVIFVESRDTAVINGLLRLYDVDGTTLLESNDDFVPGDSVRSRIISVLPAPGTYFIRYEGNSSTSSGNYRISLNEAPLRPLVPFGGVATIVTTSEAILKSPVIPNNLVTTIEFEYGLTSAYGTTVASDQSGSGGQQLITATKTLTALTPFAEYHFRVKATNAAGTTHGPDVTFLTALGMLRSESEPNSISSSANTIFVGDTVHGTISTDTDVDYFRFQAAAGDTLEIFVIERNSSGLESRIEVTDSSGGVNQFINNNYMPDSRNLHVAFVATNTGVYHIRQSYAYNYNTYYPNQAARTPEPQMMGEPTRVATSVQASSGDYELRFRRFESSAPDVRKYPWADVTFSTSALIHVDVSSNGLPTDAFVEYGTTQSLGNSAQYSNGPVTTIYYWDWFRIQLTGLLPGTQYYFRLKATNAAGTSYSEIGTFLTGQLSEKWALKPSGTDRGLSDISALDDSVAIVLAEGRMLRTTNAGTTWSDLSLPRYPYSVAFKDADTAFAIGYNIIRSDDKGATWQFQQDLQLNTYADRLRFFNPQIGAGAGSYYNQELGQWIGGIARTLDGGATWQVKGSFKFDMADVSFVSADTVHAISYNGWLYRTYNFTVASPAWDSVQVVVNEGLRGVRFVNADTGIVVGSRIWRTTNGGSIWTQVAAPNNFSYDIAMKNALVGIAVGGNGQILRTADAGATWTQEVSGASTWLRAASYTGRTAIAVGEAGTILYSIDPLGEQEPNNTSGTANGFAIGEQVEGSIGLSGDIDFYSFTAASNDTLEVLLTGIGGTPVNGALQLIGTDGSTILTQNDDFIQGDTSTARIVYVINAPGTYFVRVAGSTAGSTGTYLLKLRRTTLKPHIAAANVTVTPTSASITGLVDPNNLNTTVQVQWDTTTAYAKTPVSINEGTLSGQERRTVTATLPGLTENKDYYFRLVATNSAGTTNGVDIPFHTPRTSAFAEIEPNDSAHMAQTIAFGDSINGTIDTANDVDYYKVYVAAGDTLEVFTSRRGTSELIGRLQLIDSTSQGYYEDIDWFPSNASLHTITQFGNARTMYIRYKYSYEYSTSFPGVRDPDDVLPVPRIVQSGISQTASNDTGDYRLYVRRFVPSAPEGQDYAGYGSIFSNAVKLQTTIRPNGLPTTVNFEYGPTQAYGNQIAADNSPFNSISLMSAFSPMITGLQANTTYYVRTALTNGAGSSFGGGNTFTTPAAPDGWVVQTSGTENFLRDVEFPTESIGYAVGSGGVILKTTNGGTTWSTQTSGVTSTLSSVSFASQSVGIVSGFGGVLLKTTDGGATWTQQTSNVSFALYAVKMFSASEAVAVGANGMIIRSGNAGATWDTVRAGTEVLRAVSFTAAGDTGYAVGYLNNDGVVLRTVNRGADWATLAPITGNYLMSAWFHNGRTGVVGAGNRTFYRTTDAGATWTSTSPSGQGYYVYGMAFADTSNGVAASDQGGVFRTYDGGRNWIPQNSGTYNLLYGATMKGRVATLSGNYGTILNAVGLLATPSSLQASYSGSNTINLTWNDQAVNESGYFVERKTGSGGAFELVHTTGADATSWTDAVVRGAIYYYRLRAFITGTDTSSYSVEDTALVPLTAPFSLDASTSGSASIGLTWQSNVDLRDGFRVERATGATGPFSEIATPASGATSYSSIGLSSGTKYFYRIRSYNAAMQSAYSNIDSAVTAPGKPQNISANPSNVTNGPITISWTDPIGVATAWYNVDTPAMQGAPSVMVTPTNNSFVITNPPPGVRWIYVVLQNNEGFADLGAYDSVQIQYDNFPPQITDQTTLPTITITGSSVSDPTSVNFQASVAKPSGIASMQNPVLQYKKTNSNTVSSSPFPSLNGGTVNIGSLSSLFLTIGKPNGVEYRITASDAAGNTSSTSWRSFTVFVNTPPVSDFVAPAAGGSDDISTLVSNYRLFSVPYDLQDKKPSAFMETVANGLDAHAKDGVNYYNWRMQRFVNGTYQDYEDFKNQDVLTPGTAFFLISRVQKSITVGSGNLVKAQDMYDNGIQVLQGWNLVGNPFPDDFPSDSVWALSGSIANKAYYDGTGPDGGWWKTGTQIQTLKKWEGLAFNVTQNTSLRFKAYPQTSENAITPAPLAASAEDVIAEKKEGGWLMKFDAHRSGSSIVDIGNTIGEVPGAEEGYDQLDSFQPPLLPGKSLAVYFKNPDGAMSSDIRPIQTNGSAWEMKVVTGDRGSRVKLDIAEIVPIPDLALEAYLLDIDDHMAHNLKEQRNVEFGSKEGIRNFRVVVGSKGYVDSVSASLGIDLVPQVFMLYQNYPNPFNPETALRFWLPGAAPSYKVTLKVYNIIGQEVATLIDRDMKAGYYETTFSGRNMASGTYVYRLTVNGGTKESTFSAVKKMVMVK